MRAGLDGMVVIVTGAARGIGAAIARQAAEAGAEALVLVDRDPVTFDLPCPVETVTTDLALPDAPKDVVAAALARFGRIDGLVNAAGLTTRAGYGDATVELWNRMFSVNTRAPFFLMDGAIADMKRRGQPGSIVNILSMNAHCGQPDLAVYSATKGALLTLTKNAAHAHMADRIRVNGINLGWADTETERHLHAVTLGRGEGWLDARAAETPLGRLISPEDCARQAVWMLSPASAPMTGICLDLEQTVTGAP
ncbi:SDR family oxidoreductase [Roseibacterium sp. SDUM158016]|uniref:SDR family oxidoreductase n=1 Tax=Roseicyclus sediminis TaxID=2980997 RepID=UPI0021CDFD6B|nr:SDR family oxidoreductase [Roseibacterium sp. SDUM158016]MCU4652800.1 SDR family oxidoreductase [Roseibacterium sp. SDUM158016]